MKNRAIILADIGPKWVWVLLGRRCVAFDMHIMAFEQEIDHLLFQQFAVIEIHHA